MRHSSKHIDKNRVGFVAAESVLGINGYFCFERTAFGKGTIKLLVIASDGIGTGWEHVSVSVQHQNRLPTWDEMSFIKEQFWDDDEVVVQFHPKKEDYINNGEVLHLWKELGAFYQTPPTDLIGIKGLKLK